MRIVFLYSIFFLFCHSLTAQLRVIKPVKKYPRKTNLSIGAGFTRSVLFLSRNVKENNDAKGYTFHLIYGGSGIFRASIEYTHFRPIDIAPTWFNINAYTIETNVHIIAKVKDSKSVFYPLFGLSYNHFSGFFTGRDDFLNLHERYGTNTIVTTNWLGINIGVGYEHYFGPAGFYIDYKMRVGNNDGPDRRLNIMDVCISAGLRYNLRVPSVYKIFSGTKNRYFLETDKH
jgi:hypothetical protein